MKKIKVYRIQEVTFNLKREPTPKEKRILEGRDEEFSLFDLDIVDFDSEEVISEDYSNNVSQYIPFNQIYED